MNRRSAEAVLPLPSPGYRGGLVMPESLESLEVTLLAGFLSELLLEPLSELLSESESFSLSESELEGLGSSGLDG